MLFRGSVMLTPLFLNRFSISVTVAVGCCCLSMAQAPVTCAAASEVPDASAYPPPGIGALIRLPGASRFRNDALFDCGHIVSTVAALPFSVAPTLIAEDIQAGNPNESEYELFPEGVIVAIPTDRNKSILVFRELIESQLAVYRPFTWTRLRLTAAILLSLK